MINPPMNAVSLPIVNAKTSLKVAIALMRRSKEKGLIIRTGKDFHLHTVSGLTKAFDTGAAARLCDLAGHAIHVGDLTTIAESTPEPFISCEALVDNLKLSGKRFALLSAPTSGLKRAIIYYLENYVEPGPKDPRCLICGKCPCEC